MTALRPLAVDETPPPLLTVSGLEVSFGPLRALSGVDLAVQPGELIALAGENGAGKTTLVRCIAGDITPASGEIHLAGREVAGDPAAAARQGIAVVWQDLALCENLDVAANILLGQEPRRLLLSESRFHAAAAAVLEDLRIPLRDTTRSIRTPSGGQRHPRASAAAGLGARLRDRDRVRAGVRPAAAGQAGGRRKPPADPHPTESGVPLCRRVAVAPSPTGLPPPALSRETAGSASGLS